MVPIGCLLPFAGPGDVPDGYLLADGSEVSRTQYLSLFQILGETWGPGDGSTTFNIPDLRRRVPVGTGTGTAQLGGDVGDLGGAEDVALTEAQLRAHSHSLSAHTHDHEHYHEHVHNHSINVDTGTNTAGGGGGARVSRLFDGQGGSPCPTGGTSGGNCTVQGTDPNDASTGFTVTGPTTTGPSTPNTGLTGGNAAHPNFQPSAVVQWIIKALPDEPPPPPETGGLTPPYTLFNSLFD